MLITTNRNFIKKACCFLLCSSAIGLAQAAYPDHPIRLIVPYVAGGSTDILARLVGQSMGAKLGQSVIVQNEPGGGGAIGSATVARSSPDGYTLLMATNGTHAINPSLYSSLSYDAVKDFTPISLLAAVPLVLVVPAASPVKTVADLKGYAAMQPGQTLSFASAGVGSSGHLAGEMLKRALAVKAVHIPYKGDGQALVDLLAKRVDFSFANMPATMGYLQAKSLRPLAVSTAARSPLLPDVPTVAEAGYPQLQVDPWYGLMAPRGLPAAITKQLSDTVASVLADASVRKRIEQLGAQLMDSSLPYFVKTIAADTAKFAEVIKASGAKAD
jgi:tripartite-type tricarboxylate transporter receptor subunit TctC